VSSAAVSQQVRVLEDHWAKKLFVRQGNRIALTEAGLSVYPRLAGAFEEITELSEAMGGSSRRKRLVLSVPHSLADRWLPERLSRGLPDALDLEIRIEDDPVSFARDGVDIRLFYGHGLYSEYRIETLYHDHIVAVASPTFQKDHLNCPEPLLTLDEGRFIHTDWGESYATSPSWSGWFSKLPKSRTISPGRGILTHNSGLALALARDGLGVAFVPMELARRDLERGELLQIGDTGIPMEFSYLLAVPHAISHRDGVARLIKALKGE
jgi:LysR family glycine cleavage system transcriptional activator